MSESEKPKSNQPGPSVSQGGPSGASKVIMTRTPAQRRWRKAGIALGSVACLLAMAAGTVFGHFYWGSDAFHKMVNEDGFSAIGGFVRTGDPLHQWTPEEQFPNRTSMNVLILGVDHDYDNRDQIVKTSPGRSDSIMIARVDFVNKTINALTIPRDTAVRIPGRSGIHKINAAHNFGGEELTMETIKDVFGVQPDACVTVNFEGFQQIVNAIGGIDVDVQVPKGHKGLDYDDNWGNLHIHLKPGFQHLDGYQAMGYVRMRHSDSDEMRSKRQHDFLEAVRTKLKSPSTFMVLPKVVDKLNDNLKLNSLNRDQMFALANFARSIPRENINIKTLPSFEGPSYVTIYPEQSAKLIQEMFFPNSMVALNIDAPDPNAVREMNAPYERGSRRRGRGSRHSRRAATTEETTTTPTTEPTDASPSEPAPTSGDAPPAEPTTGGDSGSGDKNGGTDNRG